MGIDLRRLVLALSRFLAVLFMARALAVVGSWLSLRSLAQKESIFAPTRDTVAAGGITSLLVGLMVFAFAARFARWCAPDGDIQLKNSAEELAFVGVRVVCLTFVAFGLVLAASSLAGWYLQVSSADVSEIWFSGERVRSGVLGGVVAIAVGIALWPTSHWIAHRLVRSRRPTT